MSFGLPLSTGAGDALSAGCAHEHQQPMP